ncbi:MAG TPA: DUF2490 domain-containing protein [Flavitalea sp.]|nr:DUF2490 domain-containing protein [Flavitalea sp.]
MNTYFSNHILTVLIILISFATSKSQTVNQDMGWFMFVNNTKFSDKWGMALDVQVRSEAEWRGVRNLLFRPAITYFTGKNTNLSLGYLYTIMYLGDDAVKESLTENRIFQQFVANHKLSSVFVSHRFRLEQRFIETEDDNIFAQRFRYFFRLIQPLRKEQDGFTGGPFIAFQNEAFLNVQNKERMNNRLFDQNRIYGAFGYRLSPKLDVEMGYLNQYAKSVNISTMNDIVQLAVYTRF